MEICEHMEVVDANNQHVGIVEKVVGAVLKRCPRPLTSIR